jgi:hypothetical protein
VKYHKAEHMLSVILELNFHRVSNINMELGSPVWILQRQLESNFWGLVGGLSEDFATDDESSYRFESFGHGYGWGATRDSDVQFV